MNTRSLRFQLAAWYAGMVIVAFVLLGLLMVWKFRHYLEADLGQTQVRRARQIAELLLADVKRKGAAYVTNEIRSVYAPEANDRFIRITYRDGTELYVSGLPKDQSFNPMGVPRLTPAAEYPPSREQRLSDGESLIIGTYKYQAPDGLDFLVEVGAPTAPILTMLNRLALEFAVGLPIIMVAAVGGGYYLVRKALAPVDQIASKAEQITQHNLSERLPVSRTDDELERLSLSLNHMITRLEEAFLNAKRFEADASHEMRTPLTVLRGELESILSGAHLSSDARESLGSVLEEVERLTRTVEGLFSMSRLDAGEAQKDWIQFDLAKLAATTANQMSLLAEDKSISISCETDDWVPVNGDRARLKQVVVNLLDNAIKYTPEKGAVTLRVAATNGHALLEVTDSGMGIPSEALPHVFDRFFRVDKVRSRDPGGAGLGLSIVKSICTAHGAEIKVQSTLGHGSRFQVELALARAATNNHHKQDNHEH